ncbi:WhiB family transcriptional regulator [Streptomyces sp. SID8382]|uniref:WhiB family transcriptional regulator n=1 Tax=Streptomyces malaysiensis TaxID=92644 RepID=UPI000C2C3811|nr:MULTISPECIES: WhiB family transcriptional regulator [unclassified Streptomyces]MYX62773.1 WhiB family transcriptional regulator [Streptomyces sp. SID8382]
MCPSVFFSPTGERGPARRRREEAARAICRSRPVSSACGLFAEASRQAYGVRGGRMRRSGRRRPRTSVATDASSSPRGELPLPTVICH